MKKGFTLLELIVVIIILGVLATLAITQYGRVIERSRGAEAKSILGAIRTNAAAIYMANDNTCTGTQPCSAANLGVAAPAIGVYPNSCTQTTHYFSYGVTNSATGVVITATRCTGATGKAPGGGAGSGTATLDSNFSTGADTWGGTGGY